MAKSELPASTQMMDVPRVRYPITLEEFYRDYYVPRQPVIISTESFAKLGWQTQLWTNPYLLYKAGAQQVQVLHRSDRRNFAPDATHYSPMPFHEFLKVMESPEGDADVYLNLQNDKVLEPPLLQLVGDFNIPVYFKDLTLRCMNVWMGNSRGSITTPLHHDFNDNLYAVVEGRKHFTLFPPEQAANLYLQGELQGVEANGIIRYASLDNKPHMSRLDLEDVDPARFPLYAAAQTTRRECHVERDEMLFLPTGWFHQVTSIGRHIAISFISMPPSLEQLAYLKRAMVERAAQRRA